MNEYLAFFLLQSYSSIVNDKQLRFELNGSMYTQILKKINTRNVFNSRLEVHGCGELIVCFDECYFIKGSGGLEHPQIFIYIRGPGTNSPLILGDNLSFERVKS